LVSRAAEEIGARCLAIKGPVLQHHGLRGPHASIDVDVLADPNRFEDVVARLDELGWAPRIVSTTASIGTFHSRPLANPNWPVEIDVHDRFPGFLAPPTTAFDALWSRRATVEIAGHAVPAPDVVGSVAIAGLHYLRSPERRRAELDDLVARARHTLDDSGLSDLGALAAECGALLTLAPLLAALGVPTPEVTVDAEQQRAWEVLTAGAGSHSVAWVWAFRHTPPRRWPGLLRRALLLTEPEIRLLYPDLSPGRLGAWRGRGRRLVVGIRALPRALRIAGRQGPRNV
jgi:hypothetical protein